VSLLTPVRPTPVPTFGPRPTPPDRRRARQLPNRPLAVALTAVVAMLPLLRPSGPLNSSPVDLFVILALGSGLLAWSQRAMPVRGPYSVAIAFLLVGGCLGALVGPDPSAGLLAIVQDLPLFAICAVATSAMANRRVFQAVITAWARAAIVWAGLLAVGVFGHISLLSGIKAQYGVRAALTMGDPNAAANYLALSFFVVLAAGVPRRRPLRIAGLVLVFLGIILTGSNGAVSAVICGGSVATVAGLAVRHRMHLASSVMVLAAGLGVLAGALPLNSYLVDIGTRAQQSSTPIVRDSVGRVGQSAGTRSELYGEAWHLYTTGDALGGGPGSTKARLEAEQAPYVKEAHSDYSAALLERGPIGEAGVFLLLATAWAQVWHVLVRRRRSVLPARAAPLLGAVTAMSISGAFYEVLHFRQVWLLLAVVAAFRRLEPAPTEDADATR